jgi:cysteine desulfurase
MLVIKAATYLDSNAGAPLRPEVVKALLPFLSQENSVLIPNPSSIHIHGRSGKRALAEARERIAFSLGKSIDTEQLVFTSSGTEANQIAIRSVLETRLQKGEKPHWITTPVEHDSNLQMIAWLQERGGSVSLLPVDGSGRPQVDALPPLFRPETALVSVVWVNNETGVISDIPGIISQTRAQRVPLHLDAAQAWGKIPIELSSMGAQFVTFSAHKIGGLAGTGVLWLDRGNPAHPAILGKQEKGRRGGTENLLGAIAAGAAAQVLNPTEWAERVGPLRDQLQSAICERIPGTEVNGGQVARVANTLNLTFAGVEGDGLVMALDLAGYSVSSGSACASGVLEPSHVLLAMGRSKLQSMAAVRISLSDTLPWEKLEGFVQALARAVERLRQGQLKSSKFGGYGAYKEGVSREHSQ